MRKYGFFLWQAHVCNQAPRAAIIGTMPYRINKDHILKRLPPAEAGTVDEVGQRLLDQAGGVCYLCGGKLLPASEILYADHVTADAEGGPTVLNNLRLVHLSCNSAKKDKRPEEVIPYLQLKRFVREKGGQVKYDSVTAHYGITPGKTQIRIDEHRIYLEFSDGSAAEADVITELVGGHPVRYAFVQVPRVAIFNDDEVQPRSIRVEHANAIFIDLATILFMSLRVVESTRLGVVRFTHFECSMDSTRLSHPGCAATKSSPLSCI